MGVAATLPELSEWTLTVVSQLSKCLKFMTFREGCFKTCSSIQVLK